MRKKLRRRRAVSPVIAALLLIAISVAASVITYTWVMSMIDGQGKQAQTTIRFDEVSFDNTSSSEFQVKLVIRNSGGVTAQIQTFYLYDGATRVLKVDKIDYPIAAGDTTEIGFTEGETWTSDGITEPDTFTGSLEFVLTLSKAYSVKIVTDNGFTIEGTYYSPSGW